MTVASNPPADRFCDLVMKGGITSGVVYPRAIGMLSHHLPLQEHQRHLGRCDRRRGHGGG